MSGGSPSPFSAALEAAASVPSPEPLLALRTAGRESLQDLGLPSRRQEAWRFTRLKAIEETTYELPATVPPRVDITHWKLADSHLLVFVDGVLDTELSETSDLPDGVALSNLVLPAAAGSELVRGHLGSLAPVREHPFAALNTAVFSDGALVNLPPGVELSRPIHLLFVSESHGRATLAAPRILIVAGAGSRATIVESHVGTGGETLSCPVSEIVIDEGANLEQVIVHEEGAGVSHLASRQVLVAAAARYSAHAISLGGALVRSDIGVTLDGADAEASLEGFYITDDQHQADTHLTVRHRQPDCRSHQLYKGILAGASRAVFNGRIVVDQDAQRTDAKQSNRNLLLSDDATINSNPQLEIFADDVRCTHGSTVGRLDEEAIFYLRTRGIGERQARRLLTLAFAGEVLDKIPVAALRDRLSDEIATRLEEIEEHEESV
jgi:Fe-S cluster assembly protein SufD